MYHSDIPQLKGCESFQVYLQVTVEFIIFIYFYKCLISAFYVLNFAQRFYTLQYTLFNI